jgi:hypothetical protein
MATEVSQLTRRDGRKLNNLLTVAQEQTPAGLTAVMLMQQLVRAAPNA